MGSPEYSSYELKSIISALFAVLLRVIRAVEEQQEAGVAVGFVGGVVVDAAGMGGGDVASGYATLCQGEGWQQRETPRHVWIQSHEGSGISVQRYEFYLKRLLI